MRLLSNYIENGYEYQESLKEVASNMQIELEELIYEMEEIKQKIKEKEINERIVV